MKTKISSILIVLLCTGLTSFGQLFLKKGADKLSFSLIMLVSNWEILLGLCLYLLGAVLLIIALKGGELSILYPIIATSFIWVSLISLFFLGEVISMFKWAGIVFILLGLSFVGLGGDIK